MTRPPRSGAGAAAAVAASVLIALAGMAALGGCAGGGGAPTPAASSPVATPASPATTAPAPVITGPSLPPIPRTDIDSRADPQGPAPVAPERVRVPSLDIDMPVVPVGLDETGDVSIPSASHTAGWYRFSSGLRTDSGTIVVVAHIDAWDGIGPFSRLKDAPAGTEVTLTGADASRSFRVDGVAQPAKAPGSLASYFVSTGPVKLVLITCGGVFDDATGHYRENVIATAAPVGG
ncbi:sortase [Leifsonia sp. F6_8S_P_1B]|uniref:Sortase n=1 Tax=Leifsonia williamsii TaxID=3035919 RepID=A0ABT8KBV6_9MICO|nr:class F sortase [Leifsonia williamsii]MDN4614281.1 sortase [Leifsonia williamsii]